MKLFLFFVLVITLFFGSSTYANQESPHMRCADDERMTTDELGVHDCIKTTFVNQSQTCEKDTIYVWNQTGYSSYQQVICNIPVTKIDIKLDMWEQWEQYAWDFVFSGRYGW